MTGDLGDLRALSVGGRDEASEERAYAEDGVVVSSDRVDRRDGDGVVGFDVVVGAAAPAADAGEDALLAFEFGVGGIGERDAGVVAVDAG